MIPVEIRSTHTVRTIGLALPYYTSTYYNTRVPYSNFCNASASDPWELHRMDVLGIFYQDLEHETNQRDT